MTLSEGGHGSRWTERKMGRSQDEHELRWTGRKMDTSQDGQEVKRIVGWITLPPGLCKFWPRDSMKVLPTPTRPCWRQVPREVLVTVRHRFRCGCPPRDALSKKFCPRILYLDLVPVRPSQTGRTVYLGKERPGGNFYNCMKEKYFC